ncbi:glutaminase [Candidatus Margulisiibacteriota bacterium]
MDYQKIFIEIIDELHPFKKNGEASSYITELSKVTPDKFGINLLTIDNQNYSFGDAEDKFSIQSISKVFSLLLAFKLIDEELWTRVGVEPSGTPFNSLVQLEHDKGIPRNPFINAGALVICDILVSNLKSPHKELLEFIRKISGNPEISFSPQIAKSEKSVGFRNAALANLMKSFGNIKKDVNLVLDLYFDLCSIEMTCSELSRAFLFLANYGIDPISKTQIISSSKSKRINAVMQLCGLYDEAGEFSFKVGLPGKSGIGGGITAVHPGKYSIAVWSPRLNSKGNSFLGMKFLELFTTKTNASIF